jgi:hypothetical protein
MNGSQGIKRLLLGIELTLIGIVLVAVASPGSAQQIGLAVAVVGLVVALSGMGKDPAA